MRVPPPWGETKKRCYLIWLTGHFLKDTQFGQQFAIALVQG